MKNIFQTITLVLFGITLVFTDLPLSHGEEVVPFYIGTYTQGHFSGEGIYLAAFDERNGVFTEPRLVFKCDAPAFLVKHPDAKKPYLYAVGETWSAGKAKVHAFVIDPETKNLRLNNEQTVPGNGPTHLCVCAAEEGETLVVACYGSGDTISFPIDDEGKLQKFATRFQHTGSGPNPNRQKEPHPHGAYFLASQNRVFVPDLGIDKVLQFRWNPKNSELTALPDEAVAIPPGSGPRHLDFASEERFYVVNELDSTVSCVQKTSLKWKVVQSVSTLPKEILENPERLKRLNNSTAEISVHPSGRFVYASNRGHDSIAVFSVAPDSGHLSLIQTESTRGKSPRHFALTPSGKHLLAANQDSGTIFAFTIEESTGRLSPIETGIEVGSPVCILFVP